MPKISDLIKSKEIKFDNGIIIHLSETQTIGQAIKIEELKNEKLSTIKEIVIILSVSILDWNITDDQGGKFPITIENIEKLDTDTIIKLSDEIKKITDSKKNKEEKE